MEILDVLLWTRHHSLSCFQLFVTPWTAARQVSLHHLPEFAQIDWCPLSQWSYLTISSSTTLFSFCLQSFLVSGSFPMSWLCIRWPKYWSFNFSISPSNEYSGLISFRIHWFDLLAVQGTLKSLLQFEGISSSVLSNLYITAGKTVALTIRTFVGKVMPLLFNMLSRFILTFLLKSKHLWSWLEMICWINEGRPKRNGVTLLNLKS